MRRKYSIGFLLFMIIIVLLFIFVYRFSYYKAMLEMEENMIEDFKGDFEEAFYIKEADGYVTVYMADKETVYEYTSISMDELPETVQDEIKEGKKVETIGQVYGFLENYSS